MRKSLSLLVVDVSQSWEEDVKDNERGYRVGWDNLLGQYARQKYIRTPASIVYPHGSVRAGFNAIIDTVQIAYTRHVPIYAVHYYIGDTDGEEQTCHSLQPYASPKNRYEKNKLSAFSCDLAERLAKEKCKHLMIIGYDRDHCVLRTIQDAVQRNITVVTSEHCMLTMDKYNLRDQSLSYFRKHTIFLENLADVWNYIVKETTKAV